MDAVVITGERRTEVVSVPEPSATPGNAVVEIGLCGICGSDVHAWEAGTPYPPFLCGHEWFGTVIDGPGQGERVVLGVPTACGVCDSCRSGYWHRCTAVYALFGALHGGYAPRISVSAGALIPVPDALSDVEAAQVEPATVALHAVRRRSPRLGDTVVVLGAGPIGLATMQWAKLAGARRVVVAEPRPARRALALSLGVDAAEAEVDVVADVVYDCAGTQSSMDAACRLARAGGAVMMVGVSPRDLTVSPTQWLAKELTIDTSLAHHHHEFGVTMRYVADGRVQLEPLHARTVGLGEVGQAIADLAGGSDDAKILVDPRR